MTAESETTTSAGLARHEFRRLVRRLGGRRVQPWQLEIPVMHDTTGGAYRGGAVAWASVKVERNAQGEWDLCGPEAKRVAGLITKEDREVIAAAAPYLHQQLPVFPLPRRPDGRGWQMPPVATIQYAAVGDSRNRLPEHRIAQDARCFVHQNARGDGVLMVVRVPLPGSDHNGKPEKKYLPFFWSNGEWRAFLPDIDIPLYGAQDLLGGARVMVHEGQKAAHAARIITGAEGGTPHIHHPLYEMLCDYRHVGWHGGAKGLHSADLTVLRECDVFVLADMDSDGVLNARDFCRKALDIGARSAWFTAWTEGDFHLNRSWDVADSIRERDYASPRAAVTDYPTLPRRFDGRKRFNQTHFQHAFEREFNVVEPHVFTKMDDKGRPKTVETWKLHPDFVAAWAYAKSQERFYMLDNPHISYERSALNAAYRNRTAKAGPQFNTARELECLDELERVDQPIHAPGEYRIVHETLNSGPVRAINTYLPSRIRPRVPPARAKGWRMLAIRPLLQLARRIAPNHKDRHILLRWAAHVIADPGFKIRWGVILISEQQGIGKSTFIGFLSKLLGTWNTVSVPVKRLTEQSFNEFLANACLVNLEEMDIAGTAKDYNALKALLTDDFIQINRKHVDSYTQPNRLNFIGSSNRKLPMLLEETDRRWFPIESDCRSVLPTEQAIALHDWFENGNGAGYLMWYARAWHAAWHDKYDNPRTRAAALAELNVVDAPSNATKQRMVEDSVPEWQSLLTAIIKPAIDRASLYEQHAIALRSELAKAAQENRRETEKSEAEKQISANLEAAQQKARGYCFMLADIRAYLTQNVRGGYVPRESALMAFLVQRFDMKPAHTNADKAPVLVRLPWIFARFVTAGEPCRVAKEELTVARQINHRLMLFSEQYRKAQREHDENDGRTLLADGPPPPDPDATGDAADTADETPPDATRDAAGTADETPPGATRDAAGTAEKAAKGKAAKESGSKANKPPARRRTLTERALDILTPEEEAARASNVLPFPASGSAR